MPKRYVNSGRRFGDSYKQFAEFIAQIKTGKKAMIVAPDYVVISKKNYESQLTLIQEMEKIDIADFFYWYKNEAGLEVVVEIPLLTVIKSYIESKTK